MRYAKNREAYQVFRAAAEARMALARPPHAFAYIRVSHEEQVIYGLSLADQRESTHNLWERELAEQGIVWGGMFADEAKSAFSIEFRKRPHAAQMLMLARPGDHIIFAHSDRCWRNTADLCNCLNWLHEAGLTCHCTSGFWDPSTPEGRMQIQMGGVVAEYESRKKSQRIRSVFDHARRTGRWYHGKNQHVWGWEPVRGPRGLERRVNIRDLEIMQFADAFLKERRGNLNDLTKALNLLYPNYLGREWTNTRRDTMIRAWRTRGHLILEASTSARAASEAPGIAQERGKRHPGNQTPPPAPEQPGA